MLGNETSHLTDGKNLDVETAGPELDESSTEEVTFDDIPLDGIPSGKRKKRLGACGEDAAVAFLMRKGYEIIERNWTCFAGEADIIAIDGCTLVFVEVKTRRDIEKGFPSEAVGKDKRAKYEKIALAYVQDHCIEEVYVRFDVISVVVLKNERAFIRHHRAAFSVE